MAIVSVGPAVAQDAKVGGLTLAQPWTRATPPGADAAGAYLVIRNSGQGMDRLVAGSSPVARAVEIHEMAMVNNVMTMRALPSGLAIEPGKEMELKPGSYHVMLIGLKEPLRQGDVIPITLQFQDAGTTTLSFRVEAIGAQGPAR